MLSQRHLKHRDDGNLPDGPVVIFLNGPHETTQYPMGADRSEFERRALSFRGAVRFQFADVPVLQRHFAASEDAGSENEKGDCAGEESAANPHPS